jgi:hypothetical protein
MPQATTSRAESIRTIKVNLACGAIARFFQNGTMYPIDTIKTRVQVSRVVGSAPGSGVAVLRSAITNGNLLVRTEYVQNSTISRLLSKRTTLTTC